MIEVTNLRKSYGANIAVAGVSFTVQKGETFGLLGPNGAGKTTTLHMLTGALAADAGVIHINGHADPSQSAVRAHLGLAPQSLALYELLTAEENLAFFGRLYGLSGSRLKDRVEFALALSRLADRRRDRVQSYSGGMKRRLNLVCALVHEPAVVFLDEPTVGVDPQSRNYLFETIEELAKAGLTVIYTTHYMEEAERLCDRVAIMDGGKILATGTIEELIARHGGKAAVVADFAEAPPSHDALPGTINGNRLRYECDRPYEEASRLASMGLKLSGIRVEPPNLERVFLNLTGKTLRD